MRIFLDANVLFSASNSQSNVARLVHEVVATQQAVTSDLAIEEARRNIATKRPAWQATFDQLLLSIETVPSTLFELPIELDIKDRPILCAAISAGCDLFATGDQRHFAHLYDTTVEGLTIVSLLGLAIRMTGLR